MSDLDLDKVFNAQCLDCGGYLGDGQFHHPNDFIRAGLSLRWAQKGCRIGAMEAKALGPKGGVRYRIVSREAFERIGVWRAALALGVRRVRDEDLIPK